MIVNFVQFPGISSAQGQPGVFIGVKARGPHTPHILITSDHWGESVSFIICLSSFDGNLTFDVRAAITWLSGAACLIPGDGETELFGNTTSSIIMFMTINDCFLRGSGSNYYTIIILLISPEKPTKTGKWWHHWVRRCPGYRADGNSAVWSWVVTWDTRLLGCQDVRCECS